MLSPDLHMDGRGGGGLGLWYYYYAMYYVVSSIHSWYWDGLYLSYHTTLWYISICCAHPDLHIEDGWLCLTYYTIYYHAFPGSPHEGWMAMSYLLYYILPCFPRISTWRKGWLDLWYYYCTIYYLASGIHSWYRDGLLAFYNHIMHSCSYSNKSRTSWTLHGAGMDCRRCIATSCPLLMTFHGAWVGCISLHSELKLLNSCTLPEVAHSTHVPWINGTPTTYILHLVFLLCWYDYAWPTTVLLINVWLIIYPGDSCEGYIRMGEHWLILEWGVNGWQLS